MQSGLIFLIRRSTSSPRQDRAMLPLLLSTNHIRHGSLVVILKRRMVPLEKSQDMQAMICGGGVVLIEDGAK